MSKTTWKRVKDINHLKQLATTPIKYDFAIALNFGAFSRKSIVYSQDQNKFWILNHINDTEQMLKEKSLFKEQYTNIGKALESNALFYEPI